MTLDEAKAEFINTWKEMGQQWGLNPTEAAMHGFLLVSGDKIQIEEMVAYLDVVRTHVSNGAKTLIDWGLVYTFKEKKSKRQYYRAEKDIWKVAQRVIAIRRKRELDPIIAMAKKLKHVKESAEFASLIAGVSSYTQSLSGMLDLISGINCKK